MLAILAAAPVHAHAQWQMKSRTVVERGERIPLLEIVRRLAPVLWFSENEPARKDGPFPTSVVASRQSSRVVYFRVAFDMSPRDRRCARNDSYRCSSLDLPLDEPLPIAAISEMRIRFLFYYKEDYGLGAHPHDLEGLDVFLKSDESGLTIESVVGAAHGQGWYSNELKLEKADDIALPLHALVEEGKHATAPDRNADGTYTPLYDVTHYPRDAWGIRDSMIGSYLPGNSFAAHMAKRRIDTMKVWPEGPGRDGYALRHSPDEPVCDRDSEQPVPVEDLGGLEPKRLRFLLRSKVFCGHAMLASSQGNPDSARPFTRSFLELLSLSARSEGGAWGTRIAYAIRNFGAFRLPGIDGWLVAQYWTPIVFGDGVLPRELALVRWHDQDVIVERSRNTRARVEFAYMSSASKIFDPFVGVGIDLFKQERLLDTNYQPLRVSGKALISRFLVERVTLQTGATVHLPIPDSLFGGRLPPMVHLRLGVVTDEFTTIRHPRLMFEAGVGVF